MTYENDPILPLVKQAITNNVKKVTSLTEEEQTKLITLSGDQLNTLKALDERAKNDFLTKQPVLDSGIKSRKSVAEQLKSWGKYD